MGGPFTLYWLPEQSPSAHQGLKLDHSAQLHAKAPLQGSVHDNRPFGGCPRLIRETLFFILTNK
jgi:hypothetical protein